MLQQQVGENQVDRFIADWQTLGVGADCGNWFVRRIVRQSRVDIGLWIGFGKHFFGEVQGNDPGLWKCLGEMFNSGAGSCAKIHYPVGLDLHDWQATQ
jgi:hypothetical protein